MSTPVRVIARARARKGQEAAARDLLLSLIEPTRQEAGCIRYELLVGASDPTDVCMVEEWASEAALDAHLARPNVTSVLGKLGPLLAGPPDIARFKLVR